MIFTVVAVGDGACSVVRGWPVSRVMLVDCGTTGNAGVRAPETLARELGWHAALIDTVVVTHFDTDHWRGLRDIPKFWEHPPVGEVELRYPALLPGDAGLVQRSYLAVQAATLSGPIFGALDLVGAWRRAGVEMRRRPSVRGATFRGGGSTWTVHWPPVDDRFFASGAQTAMRKLATQIRELVDRVPEFSSALDEVQAAWFSDDGVEGDFGDLVTGEALSDALRTALGDQFTPFARDLSKFTNELSLVHSNDRVANFGDCEDAGLEALLDMEKVHPTLRDSYPVILAPHHGTVTPKQVDDDRFPQATHALVSQNGERRWLAGRQPEQAKFKDTVTRGRAQKLDTYDPDLAPSPLGPHLRFWLPS